MLSSYNWADPAATAWWQSGGLGANRADPSAAAWWQKGRAGGSDIWQEMLRKYLGGGGLDLGGGGSGSAQSDADYKLGLKLGNSLRGYDKASSQNMEAMLSQLLSAYGGGMGAGGGADMGMGAGGGADMGMGMSGQNMADPAATAWWKGGG